jgi:hypothetical protein
VGSWSGFRQPSDVEFWASVVYVSESGSGRIDELTPSGARLRQWTGRLSQPQGLGVDGQGSLYVADSGGARVVRFGPTGKLLGAWGAYGHGDGQFVAPADVLVDASGNAYVSDPFNNRLERFALLPGAPAASAPAPQRRLPAPRLTLKVARHQRVLRQHGVKLAVTCASSCRAVITAKGFRTLTLGLHAKHTAHRKLVLRRKLHRNARILVTGTARAPAGPSGTSKRRARVTVTG